MTLFFSINSNTLTLERICAHAPLPAAHAPTMVGEFEERFRANTSSATHWPHSLCSSRALFTLYRSFSRVLL